MEKDNSNDDPSRVTASIVDSQDTWHATADNRRRPKYHMWPKDNWLIGNQPITTPHPNLPPNCSILNHR